MRVLIVDDNFAARAVLKSILERLGAQQIVEASSGRSALEKLQAADFAFDLVLLDWIMPAVGGLDVAREMSRHQRGRRVPLIMVTAESDPSRVAEAFYAGVTNYVVKPFTPETIRRKIAEVTTLKTLEATAAVRVDGGLSGDLGQIHFEEVVQFVQLGKRTGVLIIRDGPLVARVRFVRGEAVDAEIGHMRGEAAFFDIARMRRGHFELEPLDAKAAGEPGRIATPTVHLLIEAIRRRDQAADGTDA
jgi:two-component system chemotaxis response regulator CheY